MSKNLFYSLLLGTACLFSASSLQGWDCCDCSCDSFFSDVAVEARVAYYSPSSKKVRKIYGNGWADYQIEISKGIGCGWRVWTGVSGFSRTGYSLDFGNKTNLQLVPVNLGLKYNYNLNQDLSVFVGGAGCYSFLNIHDHSDYVKQHTHKGAWGGLVQSGLKYNFSNCGYVSVFADYFFQEFKFHDTHDSAFQGSTYYYPSRYVNRETVDFNGYKVGVGIGFAF